MNRIPEVFDDYDHLKTQLKQSRDIVVFCTPGIAAWIVDENYLPLLEKGQAVKVEKRGDGLLVVPVKWDRSEETSNWDWVEVDEAYVGDIKTIK